MTLHTKIKDQIKEAMKEKDAVRLGVVRGLVSNFTNELVTLKRTPQDELTDEETLSVIRRAVKQRKDSIEQFEKGGRMDLVETEKAELSVLETYLPAQMSHEEVTNFVKAKISELGMSDPSKKGMLVGLIMKDLKGKTDGNIVKSVIEALIG